MKRMLGALMLVLVSVATPRSADAQSSPAEIAILKKKAAAGDVNAQFNLGYAYSNGTGVPEDKAEAVKWYRLAAAQGDAKAQFNLGLMYDNGERVPEDKAEAVKWYRLAAAQGDATAQLNLGLMYANGTGVPEDYVQAYKWWNLAAAAGDTSAVKNKNIVAAKMTKEQIAEAQRLSTAFKPTKTPLGLSVPLQAESQARTVFAGIPSIKIGEAGIERIPTKLSRVQAVDAGCVISQIGDRFYWASRDNKEMTRTMSGAFITFIAVDGAGYVRVTAPDMKQFASMMGKTESEYDYVEHLLIGLRSVTYYGVTK